MKKILLTYIVIVTSIFQVSAQCLMYPVLLGQRVSQSNLIIEGKVINQQSFWNNTHDKIFTSNLVEVYKTFKNTSAAYIEIITEGGTVGNDRHVFEPTLELEIGLVGVFTLNQNSQASQFGKQVYEAYASAQGFIKYDVVSNVASEPFNNYSNASTSVYNAITQLTGANYIQIKPINPFQQTVQNVNVIQNVAAITSFTPTTITAGTYSVLTINGSGFGTVITPSLVTFKNADNGGSGTISPLASEITSWTATQIQVKVPSKAGTGTIGVNGANSSGTLTIPYSHINVDNGAGYKYITKHINQTGGGYTWTYNTAFNTNAPAKAAFQRSLQSWRCATFINWPTAATTSTISASANDNINIVTFNSALAAGVLGQCAYYASGCGSDPNQTWFISELDIQFANNPGGTGFTWQYGTAAPSTSQYDFESVTVHELGHGHQLGHVIKSLDLMHYSLTNGQSKRALNTDDLNGGLTLMVRNAQAGGTCGQPLMTPLTASNCALGSPTASFTANRTTVCPGQTVAFTNLSTGSPTANAWTFAGGTPSTSAVSNPTITYNTPGTYSVQLVASNVNGSSTYSVTAYINVVSVASLPLVQDFQGTFVPANWYTEDSGNDNVKWSKSLSAGALTSTNSAVFDNFTANVAGTRDELKTFVNLSGYTSAKMTFYRAYGQTFTSPNIDSLEIKVGINCGLTTTQVYYKGGSQIATGNGSSTSIFIPTAAEWAKDSIDLTPYIGENSVMISFINRSNYGDGLYIDKINITGVAATSPTAAINSASVGCIGVPITLTDASTGGPSSWLWTMTGGAPSTSTVQNTSVTYTTAGVKTITLTVANGTGTTTATKTITITATPTVAASITNTTICRGSSVSVTVTGAAIYTWLPSGSGSSSVLSPTTTTVYTITGSNGSCNSAPRTVTINVTPTPTTNVTASATTICVGQTATLTASGASTYAWLPGGQTTTVVAVTPTANTTYTVTGSNGTCNSSKTITINVSTTPTVAASITNTTICRGSSVSVTVTGATIYTWLPSGSGSSSVLSPTTTTIYTITGSNGSCNSGPRTVTINVTPTPTTNVTASATTICIGQTATLTASGASTYAWLPGGQTTAVVAVTPTTNTTYTVTGASGTCNSSKTITINVSSTPTVAASITNTTICRGSSVTITVTGATIYTWLPSGSGSSSVLSPTTTTIYTITGSNGSCNSAPRTVTVNVTPSPTVNVVASPTLICTGTSSSLTATGATNYTWSPAATLSSASGSLVAANPTVTTTYTVVGNSGTCSNTKTITLTVSACTGIDQIISSNNISIFPNPSNGLFTVSNTIATEKLEIIVTNAIGQTILSETAKNTTQLQIDLSKVSRGIYYLKATTIEGTKLFKLILE